MSALPKNGSSGGPSNKTLKFSRSATAELGDLIVSLRFVDWFNRLDEVLLRVNELLVERRAYPGSPIKDGKHKLVNSLVPFLIDCSHYMYRPTESTELGYELHPLYVEIGRKLIRQTKLDVLEKLSIIPMMYHAMGLCAEPLITEAIFSGCSGDQRLITYPQGVATPTLTTLQMMFEDLFVRCSAIRRNRDVALIGDVVAGPGSTANYSVLFRQYVPLMKKLIDAGATPNQPLNKLECNQGYCSPVSVALRARDYGALEYLLGKGADLRFSSSLSPQGRTLSTEINNLVGAEHPASGGHESENKAVAIAKCWRLVEAYEPGMAALAEAPARCLAMAENFAAPDNAELVKYRQERGYNPYWKSRAERLAAKELARDRVEARLAQPPSDRELRDLPLPPGMPPGYMHPIRQGRNPAEMWIDPVGRGPWFTSQMETVVKGMLKDGKSVFDFQLRRSRVHHTQQTIAHFSAGVQANVRRFEDIADRRPFYASAAAGMQVLTDEQRKKLETVGFDEFDYGWRTPSPRSNTFVLRSGVSRLLLHLLSKRADFFDPESGKYEQRYHHLVRRLIESSDPYALEQHVAYSKDDDGGSSSSSRRAKSAGISVPAFWLLVWPCGRREAPPMNELLELALQRGVNPDALSRDGRTLLAKLPSSEIRLENRMANETRATVRLLLEFGANANLIQRNGTGRALRDLCNWGEFELVMEAIAAGADPDFTNGPFAWAVALSLMSRYFGSIELSDILQVLRMTGRLASFRLMVSAECMWSYVLMRVADSVRAMHEFIEATLRENPGAVIPRAYFTTGSDDLPYVGFMDFMSHSRQLPIYDCLLRMGFPFDEKEVDNYMNRVNKRAAMFKEEYIPASTLRIFFSDGRVRQHLLRGLEGEQDLSSTDLSSVHQFYLSTILQEGTPEALEYFLQEFEDVYARTLIRPRDPEVVVMRMLLEDDIGLVARRLRRLRSSTQVEDYESEKAAILLAFFLNHHAWLSGGSEGVRERRIVAVEAFVKILAEGSVPVVRFQVQAETLAKAQRRIIPRLEYPLQQWVEAHARRHLLDPLAGRNPFVTGERHPAVIACMHKAGLLSEQLYERLAEALTTPGYREKLRADAPISSIDVFWRRQLGLEMTEVVDDLNLTHMVDELRDFDKPIYRVLDSNPAEEGAADDLDDGFMLLDGQMEHFVARRLIESAFLRNLEVAEHLVEAHGVRVEVNPADPREMSLWDVCVVNGDFSADEIEFLGNVARADFFRSNFGQAVNARYLTLLAELRRGPVAGIVDRRFEAQGALNRALMEYNAEKNKTDSEVRLRLAQAEYDRSSKDKEAKERLRDALQAYKDREKTPEEQRLERVVTQRTVDLRAAETMFLRRPMTVALTAELAQVRAEPLSAPILNLLVIIVIRQLKEKKSRNFRNLVAANQTSDRRRAH